jgi:hypothetical protein
MSRNVFVCAAAVTFGSLSMAAFAQQPASLKARELFYAPPEVEAAKTSPESAKQDPAKKETKKAQPVATKKAEAPTKKTTETAQKETGKETAKLVPAAASSVPLALRYSVLKQTNGRYQEVDPEGTFRSGDRIRITVRPNDEGYLYVVMRGSSGTWSLLFPSKEFANGDNKLKRGQDYQIPTGGQGQFVFDERAGEERLFLVFARQPEQNLDQLIYQLDRRRGDEPNRQGMMLAESRSAVSDSLIERLRSEVRSRDLVFEKVDEKTPAPAGPAASNVPASELAVYVANPKHTPEAKLIADIVLKHQ